MCPSKLRRFPVCFSLVGLALLLGGCGGDSHDDPPAPKVYLQLDAASYAIDEGAGSITIAVTRTGCTLCSVGIDYATSDGTAAAGSDYTTATGTLSWPSGDTADKTFVIPISDDGTVETDETVEITLSNPTGGAATGTPGAATLTIQDNDGPGVLACAAGAYQVGEGAGSVTITVSRTGGSGGAVSVDYATSNGSASAGSDYSAVSGTFNWASGDTSDRTAMVTIQDDITVEGDETFDLTLTNPLGGAILGAPAAAVVTIIDDDGVASGSPDVNFGAGGAVTGGIGVPLGVAIDASYIYAVGIDESLGSDTQWRIEKRSTSDGMLDSPGFGSGGVVTTNPSGDWDGAFAIAIDASWMYVVGWDVEPGDPQWRIEKRSLADGTGGAGFGSAGILTTNPSPREDYAIAIAINSTSLFVAGADESPNPGDWQWRVEKRNLSDGLLDLTFGPGQGVHEHNSSSNEDWATGIALDSTWMYIAGYDELGGPGDREWRMDKFDATTDQSDPGFGGGIGLVWSDPSTRSDSPGAICIDSTYMYVVGNDKAPLQGDKQWRIEKRLLSDGSPETGFGNQGAVTVDWSPGGEDDALAIVIDATYLYVAGYNEAPGPSDWQWCVGKWTLADGSPDTNFGIGGVVESNPSPGDDQAKGIVIDSSFIYIVGSDSTGGTRRWRVEKRHK